MSMQVVSERGASPAEVFRQQIEGRSEQFAAALPKSIPVERFLRVVKTAVANNPALLSKVNRGSLFNAAMRAAQDGLLPDGREGAIVEFGGKAQWMPMIGGLRKKVRNSGEITSWQTYIVFENDEFDYELGDRPFIRHKPTLSDPGRPIAAYSVAWLRSGEISREVMSVAEIEKVRQASRARNAGPWRDWWEEMARKTVARRHAKVLPMSTDLDDLMRRDDEIEDGARGAQFPRADPPRSLAGRLDQLAAPKLAQDEAPAEGAQAIEAAPERSPPGDVFPGDLPSAYHLGRAAFEEHRPREVPPELRGKKHEAEAADWFDGYDEAAAEADEAVDV